MHLSVRGDLAGPGPEALGPGPLSAGARCHGSRWTSDREAAAPLADEALRTWAANHAIDPEQLSLTPADLGVRITYLASGPPTETSAPECDFAVPFA